MYKNVLHLSLYNTIVTVMIFPHCKYFKVINQTIVNKVRQSNILWPLLWNGSCWTGVPLTDVLKYIPQNMRLDLCLLIIVWVMVITLIARFMRPTWGPSGVDKIQVGPMLALWTLLSGCFLKSALWYILPRGSTICSCLWMPDICVALMSVYNY